MRFMILVKADEKSEAGVLPGEEVFEAMADYHEELARAGVLLDAAGLRPSSDGWRMTFSEGEAVLLEDQDRTRWDHLLIRRGLGTLDRAESLAGSPDRYTLQAKIAACHARAPSVEETDWIRIVALYGVLARVEPSPVVALNQAVASDGRSARSRDSGW